MSSLLFAAAQIVPVPTLGHYHSALTRGPQVQAYEVKSGDLCRQGTKSSLLTFYRPLYVSLK